MKRRILIPLDEEPPKERRTGTYNEQERVRHELAYEEVPYHPNKPILGYVGLAERYTESADFGTLKMSTDAVVQVLHAIGETPALGEIVIDDTDWPITDEAVQIGVIWPNGRVPRGVFMRGKGCAPKHRMEVCLKTIPPREAHEFQEALMDGDERKNAIHTRLSQVMHRLVAFAASGDVETHSSFGIEGTEHALSAFLADLTTGSGEEWNGRVYAPARHTGTHPQGEHTASALRRGWEMGEDIWTDNPTPWGGWPTMSEDFAFEDEAVAARPQVLPPIYKEKRTSLHINLGGDFWVEETRCPSCAQRLIIHAPASMCPSGRPVGLTVKCGDCKHSFGWP